MSNPIIITFGLYFILLLAIGFYFCKKSTNIADYLPLLYANPSPHASPIAREMAVGCIHAAAMLHFYVSPKTPFPPCILNNTISSGYDWSANRRGVVDTQVRSPYLSNWM